MRFFVILYIVFLFISCKNKGGGVQTAEKLPKQKITPERSFFSIKSKKHKEKIDDGFTSSTQTKNYGDKSNGKKIRFRRKQSSEREHLGDGFASTGRSYSMNYREKAKGKKAKKRHERKIEKERSGTDAFASRVELNKNAPSNSKKGKHKKEKKKRKWFHFRSKEERMQQKQKNNPMSTNSRAERKAMKKQKKKREYGLGMPSH